MIIVAPLHAKVQVEVVDSPPSVDVASQTKHFFDHIDAAIANTEQDTAIVGGVEDGSLSDRAFIVKAGSLNPLPN
ncbi:MAG: hypothetical protein AAF571_10225, partial [Verrucomicrobiota bacterium]